MIETDETNPQYCHSSSLKAIMKKNQQTLTLKTVISFDNKNKENHNKNVKVQTLNFTY